MKKENQWIVYIIQTTSGKLYTGITNNLERRFSEHLKSKKGAKYFHLCAPKAIVFQEKHPDRSSATRRELEIKKMDRQKKLALLT